MMKPWIFHDLPGLVDAWHLLMPMLSSKDAGSPSRILPWHKPMKKWDGLLLLYSHDIIHLDYDYDPWFSIILHFIHYCPDVQNNKGIAV